MAFRAIGVRRTRCAFANVMRQINVPDLIYGDQDWSRQEEWRRTAQAMSGANVETVANGGHFLSLDQPERLAELIKSFAGAKALQTTKLDPDDRV